MVENLNGQTLYMAFLSGSREIINNKEILNKINVFPVADGDTGSNLVSTVNYIVQDAKVLDTAKATMKSIADAALMGARGNSGIILAQYINGLSMVLEEKEEFSISDFADSVYHAYEHAYNSISDPVEGTILTVIRDWSYEVFNQKNTANNFYELLKYPLQTALRSLEETKFQLKILKKSKVVDAGAKGFVYFIQGFTEYIRSGNITELDLNYESIGSIETPTHQLEDLTYRYCTEAIVTGDNLSSQMLKDNLGILGNSLIIAGNESKIRIHIHTNEPHKVMSILNEEGLVLQQKVDDMKRQYERQHERKYKIALVTDSIADVPKEILDKYQVNVIPLNIMMHETSYLDKLTMVPEIFYDILDEVTKYPSSSQPNPSLIEDLYASLVKFYDEILVISVSKEQSGTYNIFKKSAEKFSTNGKRIEVIDSKQNSGAEGLLVFKAAELISQELSLDEIVDEIEALRDQTKILVSVNTLKYMIKSGRLSKVKGLAGKIINLKPVVSLDDKGRGVIEENAFSLKSNTRKILNILEKSNTEKNITRYAILHANNPMRAEDYRKKCLEVLKMEPEYIMNISTIVGMSAGVGAVAVAYMMEDDENENNLF